MHGGTSPRKPRLGPNDKANSSLIQAVSLLFLEVASIYTQLLRHRNILTDKTRRYTQLRSTRRILSGEIHEVIVHAKAAKIMGKVSSLLGLKIQPPVQPHLVENSIL
jgi:hypothetical protein